MRDTPPAVLPDVPVATAILEITKGGIGMTTVVTPIGNVVGIFTDGDLRRAFEKNIDLRPLAVSDVMTTHPRTIGPDKLAVEAVEMMEQFPRQRAAGHRCRRPTGRRPSTCTTSSAPR